MVHKEVGYKVPTAASYIISGEDPALTEGVIIVHSKAACVILALLWWSNTYRACYHGVKHLQEDHPWNVVWGLCIYYWTISHKTVCIRLPVDDYVSSLQLNSFSMSGKEGRKVTCV